MQCQPRRNPQDVDAIRRSKIPRWPRRREKAGPAAGFNRGMGDAMVGAAADWGSGLPRSGYRKIIRLQPFSLRDQG